MTVLPVSSLGARPDFNVRKDRSFFISEIEVDPSWTNDLGEDFFEYRRKWEEAAKYHKLFDFPLFVEVEAQFACNFRCIMCPTHPPGSKNKGGELPPDLFDKLFKEAKAKKLASISLSHGGEPLLHRNIAGLVRNANEAGILDIMFHTNASLLSKDLSRRLIEAGLTKINFSLDAATKQTYEKIRLGGKFERVTRNVLDFLEAKKEIGKSYPRVRVSFVEQPLNTDEAEAFFEFWGDKVNVVAFQQCRDYAKEADNSILFPEKIEFCCTPLWHLMMISEDGSIMPCLQDYRHEMVLGNLRTHTIEECWKSEKMQWLRKLHSAGNWYENPTCKRCVLNVKRETGDLATINKREF